MSLNARSRRLVLITALLATVLAVIFAPPGEEPVQPMHLDANSPQSKKAAPSNLFPLQAEPTGKFMPQKRTGLQDGPGDLFLVDRPPPPPKVSSRPVPPPAPVAPPLPYVYMGKMIEAGELTVFLTRGDKPYVAKVGDILDGQYRVESIRPPLVEFVYIPLGQKQMLNIGAADSAESGRTAPVSPNNMPLELQQKLKQMLNTGASQ